MFSVRPGRVFGTGVRLHSVYLTALAAVSLASGYGASRAVQSAIVVENTDQSLRHLRSPSRVEMGLRASARHKTPLSRPERPLVIVLNHPQVSAARLATQLDYTEATEVGDIKPSPIAAAAVVRRSTKKVVRSETCRAECKKRKFAAAKSKRVKLAKLSTPNLLKQPSKFELRFRGRIAETTGDIIQRNLNFRG